MIDLRVKTALVTDSNKQAGVAMSGASRAALELFTKARAGDDASFVQGVTLLVDGGRLAT